MVVFPPDKQDKMVCITQVLGMLEKKLRIKSTRIHFSIEKSCRKGRLFPELSPHQVTTILDVLSDISSIVGLYMYLEHLWYVNENNVLQL